MKKNLPTIKQDSNIVLLKTKSLIGITNKILVNKTSKDLADYSWIERLWDWADENDIPNEIIPREVAKLLELEEINLQGKGLNEIPNELTYLKNLTFLELSNNNLTQLPSNIGDLKNLNFLSIAINNITKVPNSITKLKKLNNFWFTRNNLLLKQNQLAWIEELKRNGCYIYS